VRVQGGNGISLQEAALQHLAVPNNGSAPASTIKKSKDFDDSKSQLLKDTLNSGKVNPQSDAKANVDS
jgi:hypothetical protein